MKGYIFGINQTGTWVNSSLVLFSGTTNVSTNVSQITAASGTTVEWRFYAKDRHNNWNATDVQSFVVGGGGGSGTLTAILVSPTGSNSQPVNQTFMVYANVSCTGAGSCGNVDGSIVYNASGAQPSDNMTGGSYNVPFYTLENNPLSCGAMTPASAPCALNWTVNATGAVNSAWKIAVNFSSSDGGVSPAVTDSTNITIIDASLSITISDALRSVDFGGNLNPGSYNNTALNNSQNMYNITCSYSLGSCNISIKGNNDLLSGATTLGVGNVSWNQANSTTGNKRLSSSYAVINSTLSNLASQLIYFWLDIPSSQVAGTYSGNFTIQGQPN